MKTNFLKFNQSNKWIALVVLALIISACSSDDGPGNQAPHKVSVINPSNSTKDIDVSAIELQWTAATDPNNDAVTYDVYLDTVTPPVNKVKGGISELNLKLQDDLDFGKTYYWSVKAVDESGAESSSDIASFTTRELTTEELIVGKWFIETVFNDGTEAPETECLHKSFFEFRADGMLKIVFYFDEQPCALNRELNFNYDVMDTNNVAIFNESGSIISTIISLTTTHMEFKLNAEQKFNLVREQ